MLVGNWAARSLLSTPMYMAHRWCKVPYRVTRLVSEIIILQNYSSVAVWEFWAAWVRILLLTLCREPYGSRNSSIFEYSLPIRIKLLIGSNHLLKVALLSTYQAYTRGKLAQLGPPHDLFYWVKPLLKTVLHVADRRYLYIRAITGTDWLKTSSHTLLVSRAINDSMNITITGSREPWWDVGHGFTRGECVEGNLWLRLACISLQWGPMPHIHLAPGISMKFWLTGRAIHSWYVQ